MNDEVKEILIDLIDYWNTLNAKDTPQIFAAIVQRSSTALDRYHKQATIQTIKDIDVFEPYDEFPDFLVKMEDEW